MLEPASCSDLEAHLQTPASCLGLSEGFHEIADNRQNPYFFYSSPGDYTFNSTTTLNVSTFNVEEMNVTKLSSSIFTYDLTERDDILIAVLSLFLLLIIEGMVTTLLLRSIRGNVSNFGFSVKQFVELVRDFRFRQVARRKDRHKLNYCLLVVSVVFLVSTFVLEVVVLLLTDEGLRGVSNTKASFRLVQPITPEWLNVRFQSRVGINRACNALTLEDVEQERTGISTCVVSDQQDEEFLFVERKGKPKMVDYRIVSSLHQYGAEHQVTVDNLTAKFSARAYFQLQDGKERLMSEEENVVYKPNQVFLIHKMYIGFLMTSHKRATKDKKLTEALMQELKFTTSQTVQNGGGPIGIIQSRDTNEFLTVPSTTFKTLLKAPDIGSKMALAYARPVFKASIGVAVLSGNTADLMVGSGRVERAKSEIWKEKTRALNWLSLLITLALAFCGLAGLRCILKPVGSAELAGVYVGAMTRERDRGPLEESEGKEYFGEETEASYSYGAETEDYWRTYFEEYDEKT